MSSYIMVAIVSITVTVIVVVIVMIMFICALSSIIVIDTIVKDFMLGLGRLIDKTCWREPNVPRERRAPMGRFN